MRKLISLLLALVMVMGLATVAFAAEQDQSTSFNKKYIVNNGTAPADTFKFNVAFEGYKNNEGEAVAEVTAYPTVTLGDAEFANALTADGTAAASVEISNYDEVELGVYTYKISEVVPEIKTAGTTYNAKPVYLVVTILRDEQSKNHYVAAIHYEAEGGKKIGDTTNEYDAGQLAVTKQISGNMADMEKKFAFTATFTPETGDKFDASVQVMTDNARTYSKTTNDNGEIVITFELGDGDTATFTNVPANATYTVVEVPEKYTSSWENGQKSGTINANEEEAIEVTNTLTSQIDTGIALDSIPFVVMMVVCAAAAVLFVIKRRSVEF